MVTEAPIKTTDHTALDSAISELQAHKNEWAKLPISRKIELLQGLVDRIDATAARWVATAVEAKGIKGTQLEGEEWISGPWALTYYLQSLKDTLVAIQKGKLRDLVGTRTRANGQLVTKVFPNKFYDYLLLGGFYAEVWMQPDVTQANLAQHMGLFFNEKNPVGKVALVLGAGNLSSIAPLDILYKLYAEGQVVICKMNPVNDYLQPFFEEVFAEFIASGFVRFVHGNAEVAKYIIAHDGVDEIHITGSARTHDAIVFGEGDEGNERKIRNEPLLEKRITSELGASCPVIVIQGEWSDADIHYHAMNIATMKMHNAGYNCVAAQVLILPEAWKQKDQLVSKIREILKNAVNRPAYYPGSPERQQQAVQAHPQAEILDNRNVPTTLIPKVDATVWNDVCFRDEVFGGVLTVTTLPGETPAEFLKNAVKFSNETLWGTLGANILVHPKTKRELGQTLENAIGDLRYGAVAVNAWSGGNYLVMENTWGAYPGHTFDDIQSGIGIVHNTRLLDHVEKSVIYGPFYPYPRNLAYGEWHMSPIPAWFITNKQAHNIGRRIARFAAKPGLGHLPGIFMDALRGQFMR